MGEDHYLPITFFSIIVKTASIIERLGENADAFLERFSRRNEELVAECSMAGESLIPYKEKLEGLGLTHGVDFVLMDAFNHALSIQIAGKIGSEPELAVYPGRILIGWLNFELREDGLYARLEPDNYSGAK